MRAGRAEKTETGNRKMRPGKLLPFALNNETIALQPHRMATALEFRYVLDLKAHIIPQSARLGCLLHLQSHGPGLGCFGQHILRLVIEEVVLEAGQRRQPER